MAFCDFYHLLTIPVVKMGNVSGRTFQIALQVTNQATAPDYDRGGSPIESIFFTSLSIDFV